MTTPSLTRKMIGQFIRLVWAGLAAVFLFLAGTLVPHRPARADDIAKKDPRRVFYLSKDAIYDGSQPLGACVAGFHMASLWEIHDPSNLRYDTSLGFTRDDSGSGPPASALGWARTGFDKGVGNCLAWTTNSGTDTGTSFALPIPFQPGDAKINPWEPSNESCANQRRVWCVQD